MVQRWRKLQRLKRGILEKNLRSWWLWRLLWLSFPSIFWSSGRLRLNPRLAVYMQRLLSLTESLPAPPQNKDIQLLCSRDIGAPLTTLCKHVSILNFLFPFHSVRVNLIGWQYSCMKVRLKGERKLEGSNILSWIIPEEVDSEALSSLDVHTPIHGAVHYLDCLSTSLAEEKLLARMMSLRDFVSQSATALCTTRNYETWKACFKCAILFQSIANLLNKIHQSLKIDLQHMNRPCVLRRQVLKCLHTMGA